MWGVGFVDVEGGGAGGGGGRWHWPTIVFMVDFVVTVLNMSISQLDSYANCLLLD